MRIATAHHDQTALASASLGTARLGPSRRPAHLDAHFSDLIATRDAATDRTPKAKHQQAYEAAQSLVATTLIQPILSQIREDPFRSELFHGGTAEDSFGAQLDTILADRITRASNFPIVESIYNRTFTAKSEVDIHG